MSSHYRDRHERKTRQRVVRKRKFAIARARALPRMRATLESRAVADIFRLQWQRKDQL